MKTAMGIVKINLKNSNTAYLIAGITFALLGLGQYAADFFVNNTSAYTVSAGNYLYLLPVCVGIFVPAQNFSKLTNLGGRRVDFFKGAVITYAAVAACTALITVLTRLTIDRWLVSAGKIAGELDLYDVFNFASHGMFAAFIQMTALLTLIACAAHTLTLIQGRWYGWLTDALIIAVISVFTPIPTLRAALTWFFGMIIFNENAATQIASRIAVSAAVYCASLIPISKKQL